MMEYNGWTNWETWNFKLWIDNDEEIRKLVEYLMQDWDFKPDEDEDEDEDEEDGDGLISDLITLP